MTRMIRTPGSLVVAVLLTASTLAVGATPALGQAPSLERVEELTRLGRPDEARTILDQWWEERSDDASRRDLQLGLWLRGRLTVDPVQADLEYQRLVVLYPRGPYTDRALLRLAQSAHAMGNVEAARGHIATLTRDYPDSQTRRDAETWLRDAGPPGTPPSATAATPTRPDAPTTRPDAPATRPPASTTAEPEPVTRPASTGSGAAPSEEGGAYYVQLGAFAEEDRARSLFEEARAAGLDVRLVRVDGSRFLHVRYGRFVEREDAVEQLERLDAQGINAALVRDERAEQPIRD